VPCCTRAGYKFGFKKKKKKKSISLQISAKAAKAWETSRHRVIVEEVFSGRRLVSLSRLSHLLNRLRMLPVKSLYPEHISSSFTPSGFVINEQDWVLLY
jgi:hypothetical protein